MAVPAAPDESIVFQPDGKQLRVHLKGDEWKNWEETADGYTVSRDTDGFWRYVKEFKHRKRPVFVSTRAHEKAPYGLRKHIQPNFAATDTDAAAATSESVPASAPSGTFSGSILFILAEFSDRSGTYTESSWGDFISLNITDFFDASSYGMVSLLPAIESSGVANNGVVGWVNLGYPHPNTGDDTDTRNQTLTKNAIIAADTYIDYSSYDGNSDGYVDSDELAVVVIVAGFERSYSATYTPNVWGHKWSILSAPTVDGVVVGDYHGDTGGYAQFGEIHQSSSSDAHQATMGIMVHELGHLIFRLPDLYDTDGSSSGIGAWGVMSSGSWGKASSDSYSGETPVLPCAWVRYNRGWVDGTEGSETVSITGAGETAATGSNTVFRASTGVTNEYFLLENRQPAGYDRGLERWLGTSFGGLAIWHIDDEQTENTDDDHRLVDLEEADGTLMGMGRGSKTDLWYQGNSVLFNDASNPGSRLYDGSSSAISIGDISASSDTMTAYFSLESATSVPLPYSQDFSGRLPGIADGWEYYSANSYGRIEVVSERLRMDVSLIDYCLNEAVLALNLTGYSAVQLSFFQAEFNDEGDSLSDTFTGHDNGDGVAISDDGNTWYTILNDIDLDVGASGQTFNIDLDAEVASIRTTYDPSFGYTSAFKIKFQQYDNRQYSSDGREWDDVAVTGTGELFVTVPQAATEGDGLLSGQTTVSILSPASGDLIVSLSSDDVSEVTVATTATILSGETAALFDLTVEDDADYDGVQTATITASATGFTLATDTIDVADNDVHHFDLSSIPVTQIAELPFSVSLTAQNVDNETILSFAGVVNLTATGDGGTVPVEPSTTTAFTNGQWTGDVTVNAIDTNVSITADDGSGNMGTSNSFEVTSGPLDHFTFSTISSTQYAEILFNTTITARDINGYVATDFSGTVQLSGNVANVTQSGLVITECDLGAPNFIEIQNVSGQIVDTAGWVVAVSNSYTDINSVNSIYWSLPSTANPDQLLYETDDVGDNYWGSDIFWNLGNNGWAMIIDDTGDIIDFVVWGWNSADISAMNPLVNGYSITIGSQFSGGGVTSTGTGTIQRQGAEENDDETDFSWVPTSSKGFQNTSLTVPFVGIITPVLIAPVETGSFVSGTWTGDVTVLEGAVDMYLEADGGSGHTGMSGIFTVVPDTDGDRIYDDDEINLYGTNPNDADSDDDGIDDGDELDYWGIRWGEDIDGDNLINLLDYDSDGDGLSDGDEIISGYDPSAQDDPPTNIPTLNEWGMMIMTLLLIAVGMVVIRRREES